MKRIKSIEEKNLENQLHKKLYPEVSLVIFHLLVTTGSDLVTCPDNALADVDRLEIL
ncbi:hypothetical protein CHS0354_004731, partial [Potamilus streckersoni]